MADNLVTGNDIGCGAMIVFVAIILAAFIVAGAVKDAAGKLAPNPPEVKQP